MTGLRFLPRNLRAAAAALRILTVATGCSATASAHPSVGTATTGASTPVSLPPGSVVGQVTATGPTTSLVITDAVAHLDAAGDGELAMVVRNGSSVPEHLAAVTPRGGSSATLVGDGGDNGSLSPAGILLNPATTVTFGGQGPRVLLHGPADTAHTRTLSLLLEFGVAGLVHLQARVVVS